MPFSTTISDRIKGGQGDRNFVYGTLVVGDPTESLSGGFINTGLSRVDDFSMTPVSSTQLSGALNISGFSAGTVHIVSGIASGTTVRWRAYGI